MDGTAGARRLDTTALTERLAPGDVARFREESQRVGAPWTRRPVKTGNEDAGVGPALRSAFPGVFVLVVLALPVIVAGPGLVVEGFADARKAGAAWMLVAVGAVALFVGVALVTVTALVARLRALALPAGWWGDELRYTRFAAANGLRYGHEEPLDHPGVIFRQGRYRTAERRFTTPNGAEEVGVYRYANVPAGAKGDYAPLVSWGYVALRLGATLPHLLVDGRANDRRTLGVRHSNLPLGFGLSRDQRVDLGEEFGRHFTVYAPAAYHDDARRILTPDVCAALVEHARDRDLEIVDDTLYVYAPVFDLRDPATHRWAGTVVDTVGALLRRQAQRYADPRGAVPTGAATGQGEVWVPAIDVAYDRAAPELRMWFGPDHPNVRRALAQNTAGHPPVAQRRPTAPETVGANGRRLSPVRPVLGPVLIAVVGVLAGALYVYDALH